MDLACTWTQRRPACFTGKGAAVSNLSRCLTAMRHPPQDSSRLETAQIGTFRSRRAAAEPSSGDGHRLSAATAPRAGRARTRLAWGPATLTLVKELAAVFSGSDEPTERRTFRRSRSMSRSASPLSTSPPFRAKSASALARCLQPLAQTVPLAVRSWIGKQKHGAASGQKLG
jgi:hypothetical protein